jgi:hypothetical protein
MGPSATLHGFAVGVLSLTVVFFAEGHILMWLVPAAFGKIQPSMLYMSAYYGAVRIVLYQLPPPWLLTHAAVPPFMVWGLYSISRSLWSVAIGIPVWLQGGMICAAAVAVVVVQDAFHRVKYLRALTSGHTRQVLANAAVCVSPGEK